MNKKIINSITFIIAFGLFASFGNFVFAQNQQPKQASKQQITANKPINTTALNIVANPQKYLNKTVKLQATFDKFSTLGLDYSKAMRPSTKYIGILIQRDDDNRETVESRLKNYFEVTSPLVDYYTKKGNLRTEEVSKSINRLGKDVADDIAKEFNKD